MLPGPGKGSPPAAWQGRPIQGLRSASLELLAQELFVEFRDTHRKVLEYRVLAMPTRTLQETGEFLSDRGAGSGTSK